MTPTDRERLRDALDAKALEGKASPRRCSTLGRFSPQPPKPPRVSERKTSRRSFASASTILAPASFRPTCTTRKELQLLYPDEFLRLVSCALVPLEARRLYGLGVYLCVRAGELKALDWSEVDVERGIVSVRVSWDR